MMDILNLLYIAYMHALFFLHCKMVPMQIHKDSHLAAGAMQFSCSTYGSDDAAVVAYMCVGLAHHLS